MFALTAGHCRIPGEVHASGVAMFPVMSAASARCPRPRSRSRAAVATIISTLSIALLPILGCTPAETPISYPEATRGDVVENYHGVAVADPYRWLEELDSAETRAWVEAENAISIPYLEAIPVREELKTRLTALWDHERFSQPFKEGDLYFYSRRDGLQNHFVIYMVDKLGGEPRVLLDPNTFSEDGTVSLGGLSVSPDGRHVAYAKSDGGSDWRTWHVRRIDTGEDLPDLIEKTKFASASWTGDGGGFYYSRYPDGPDGQGDGSKAVKVYYHRIGTLQSEDELIYEIPEHPRRNPYGSVTDDGRYLVLNIQEGYLTNAVYYRDLATPGSPIVKLLDDWDALYNFIGNDDTLFYFQTNLEAPRNRVIAIDIENPARDDWLEVIPQNEQTLRSTSMPGGHLVASYLKDVLPLVRVFDPSGKPVRDVEFPGIGSAFGFGGKFDDPETFYTLTSFALPPTIYRYDVSTGHSEEFRRPDIDVDSEAFEMVQVFFASKDGTRIPMFITYRKGIELDGQNPTLLYGYGGFNVSLTPSFSLSRYLWLERGGVLAIPNLRGGGEYGKEWHLAGTKGQKQNVFDDFIAAAEYLIAEGYTSTPRLAIQGGSNGGLLVGAAITQRPDLFGAALPAVGVLDMLRYHLPSANARNWHTDLGLSEVKEEFEAQYAYSPYHNVEPGTCYPPTLVTTADHDDRVVPWHSYKFGAQLQFAQGCANPILVRVETRAGHGAGKPTWMQIEEIADQWTFVLMHLGAV